MDHFSLQSCPKNCRNADIDNRRLIFDNVELIQIGWMESMDESKDNTKDVSIKKLLQTSSIVAALYVVYLILETILKMLEIVAP